MSTTLVMSVDSYKRGITHHRWVHITPSTWPYERPSLVAPTLTVFYSLPRYFWFVKMDTKTMFVLLVALVVASHNTST
ncbi:hypothetical protein LSAT2_008538 [Lamellibrachia satsuma]|nr:hypothetical protein LSAT2_008538 [Lamellibrachia satsuma]